MSIHKKVFVLGTIIAFVFGVNAIFREAEPTSQPTSNFIAVQIGPKLQPNDESPKVSDASSFPDTAATQQALVEEGPGEPTSDPDVRIDHGVRMLRGKRLTGEVVWFPEDPNVNEVAKEAPVFLPAPSER